MKVVWEGEEKEISDEKEFQEKCVALFSAGKGKIFLNLFNDMLKYHSTYCPEEDVYMMHFKEGYFGLIRDINLSIFKYTLRQKNEVKNEKYGE